MDRKETQVSVMNAMNTRCRRTSRVLPLGLCETHQVPIKLLVLLVGWLNLFKAKLPSKRYWRGPRSQEVGEEGDYT